MSNTGIYPSEAGFILVWRQQRKKGFTKYLFGKVLILLLIMVPTALIIHWWNLGWTTHINLKDFFSEKDSIFLTTAVLVMLYIVKDILKWRKSEKRYKQLRRIPD